MRNDIGATWWIVAGAIVGLLIVGGGLLYLSDYGVEATIVDKGRDAEGPYVVAETSVGGFEVKRHVTQTQFAAVQVGDVIVYHIRSGEVEWQPKGGGLFQGAADPLAVTPSG